MLKPKARKMYINSLKYKLLGNEKLYSGYGDPLADKRELEVNEYINNLSKRKLIPEKTIDLFYDDPKEFFLSFKNLISENSLFDFNLTSIFEHYFYVLFTQKGSELSREIYEKNFDNFFKEFGKYLSIRDEVFDTPLHKLLTKFKNKKFFLEICQKLKVINVLSEKIITTENLYFKSCYDIIIDDIIINYKKISENQFKLYSNFLEYYPNLIKALPEDKKLIIIAFLSNIIIDYQKLNEINIIETLNNYHIFLNKLEDKKAIFKHIYNPISGINQLNIIFDGSTLSEHFQKIE